AGLEQRPAVDRPDRVVATENLRQSIGAIRPDGANPAEMIEAQVVEPHRRLRHPQLRSDFPAERGRAVTDADHAGLSRRRQRLCDQTRGIREVDDPRLGCPAAEPRHKVGQDWNGPERHCPATRTRGLLPHYAICYWDPPIDDPAWDSPYATPSYPKRASIKCAG